MNALTTGRNAGEIMEAVLLKGDLGKLTPQERTDYYNRVCESIGLNPLTQPFAYITLNSKMTLYAKRDAADQLRKINGISIEIVDRSVADGLLTVHVRAKDRDGRTDEDLGVVSIGGLKGEAAANAVLKAVTKAKRRVTLSISGLGFLDETEVDDVPTARRPVAEPIAIAAPKPPVIEAGPITGEAGPRILTVPEKAGQDGEILPDWITFGQTFIAAVATATSLPEADDWMDKNDGHLGVMKEEAPKVYARMSTAIAKHRATLIPKEDASDPGPIPEFLDRRQNILAAG